MEADRPPGFTLDHQLCFALYTASRAVTARYRKELAGVGLTYSQYLVMLVLWEHGSVSMGFLAEQLHLDSGTLSPLLKRLERRGRLSRSRRAQDERTVEITCTLEGQQLRETAYAAQQRVERATGLAPDALRQLRGELSDLTARLWALENEQAL